MDTRDINKPGVADQQKQIQQLMDAIMELPFHAQQGVLRTLAPKVISKMEGEERRGFIRDLNQEIEKADRGEPTYDYRPFDQSAQP